MGAYRTAVLEGNLLDPLVIPAAAWSIERRLSWSRGDNPGHNSGRGSARRSRYEHQLDEHLLLLRAADDPSGAVLIGRHHCRARRGQWITPVEEMACRCKTRQVHPWLLLYSALEGRRLVVDAYRAKLLTLLRWLRDNHPRAGWGEPMSKTRRARVKGATDWYLRAAAWPLFYAWRRVVTIFVEMLRTLDRWWFSLLPVPRSSSPARNEQETRSAPSSRAEQRSKASDAVQVTETAPARLYPQPDALWRRVRERVRSMPLPWDPGECRGLAIAVAREAEQGGDDDRQR